MGTSLALRHNGTHEKISESIDTDVPGPGTYKPMSSQVTRNISTCFGKDKRMTMSLKSL